MEDFPTPKSFYYINLPGFAVLYPACKPAQKDKEITGEIPKKLPNSLQYVILTVRRYGKCLPKKHQRTS